MHTLPVYSAIVKDDIFSANDLGAPATVTARIRASAPSLQPAAMRVAETFLRDPAKTIRFTIADVANLAGTSATTVVRCCQSLGFVGYRELKIALAHELGLAQSTHQDVTDIHPDDSVEVVLERILNADASAIRESLATIVPADFARAVEILITARKVLVAGIGTSAPIAQDAAYRFLTIGLSADAPPDGHVQHVAAGLLGPADACLIVSHTGATRETLSVAKAASSAKAKTIAITSFSQSPLVDVVDIALVCGASKVSFRLAAMASRIGHLSVVDALYVASAMRLSTSAQESLDRAEAVISTHRL